MKPRKVSVLLAVLWVRTRFADECVSVVTADLSRACVWSDCGIGSHDLERVEVVTLD